jgi:hypothetical protein
MKKEEAQLKIDHHHPAAPAGWQCGKVANKSPKM